MAQASPLTQCVAVLARMAHGHDHLVDRTIIDQRNASLRVGQHFVVKPNLDNTALHVARVFNGDFIGGSTMTIANLEAAPGFRNRRIDQQAVAHQLEAEYRFQTRSVQPRAGTGVPGPATTADMWRY